MLLLRICDHCREGFQAERTTAHYCSDRCKKAAARSSPSGPDDAIYNLLRRKGLAAQVWPVFRWDQTTPVLALMVPRSVAVTELNAELPAPITDPDLVRVLRSRGIIESIDAVAGLVAGLSRTRREARTAA